jgi:DNA-binding MarR family transcriptional regulator
MTTLFGSKVRTDVLVAIARLDLTYPSEVARVLSLRLVEVQRAVSSLERSNAVVSRRIGNTRSVSLNRRFPAADELYALLLKLSEDPWYEDRWAELRRRPRAIGKRL